MTMRRDSATEQASKILVKQMESIADALAMTRGGAADGRGVGPGSHDRQRIRDSTHFLDDVAHFIDDKRCLKKKHGLFAHSQN